MTTTPPSIANRPRWVRENYPWEARYSRFNSIPSESIEEKRLQLTLLKLESRLDGIAGRGPVRFGGLEGLEDDLAATTVLVVDQLLGVLALLLSALLEELLETGQGLVDMASPGREGEVHLRSLKLLANLFIREA